MERPNYNFEFLPGVSAEYVLQRLNKSDGNEVSSGKLRSPESSAALAANTFGWFHERPERLPHFPIAGAHFSPAVAVEIEYCARFPWRGGRHAWLDALVETREAVIGIESKRFEPFRGPKAVGLSATYDRDVWGNNMAPYKDMKERLREEKECFHFLDATQLVKHALGLVTEGQRKTKRVYLIYLFAEPLEIDERKKQNHRDEIARFASAVSGARVTFEAISYREWLSSWPDSDRQLADHGKAIIEHFQP